MKGKLSLETAVTINASPEKVWKAITTPEHIAKYLFGTKVTSDWKEESVITYQGEYNGTHYHDKGIIKTFDPYNTFAATYWSSMSGKEDLPENYNLVTYSLEEKDGKTVLTLQQDNIGSEREKEHSQTNWEMVLKELKKVAESL
jgi:uncharacterized protein YndB with AHSA1/START domain